MKILSFRGSRAVIHQWFTLVRITTFSRLLNYLGLRFSYSLSVLRGYPLFYGAPMAVSIEPTTACNLRCPECPSGTGTLKRPGGKLSLKQFESILAKLPTQTSWLTFYFQGEPYLNRDFPEMVKLAKKRRMFVSTSTNGHVLDIDNARKTIASGLDKIIISIDGSDAETYLDYRKGGDFEKVIAGVKRLTKLKRELKSPSPLVVIQFLVFRQNEHQIKDIATLSRSLGADVLELKTAQHYDYEDGNPYMTSIDKYSRYRKKKTGKYAIKGKMHKHCWRMWSSCVITWDGSIVPCCYDKNAEHCYGNLQQKDFKDIWKGNEAGKFREQLWRSRKEIDICSNCHE
jgi:radical SAM protein with 4Fe4S-binding SPASM domain